MRRTAHDVAALLINEQHAAGRTIDRMQLQKLLYLVQGANLEFWGEPAFGEKLLAYRNGPAVREVEATYPDASVGRDPLRRPMGDHPERVSWELVETVRTVLTYFGTWKGLDLERHVKGPDSPWQRARGRIAPHESSDVEIPLPTMEAWFRDHGVDPEPTDNRSWDPTAEELRAADERLREAKAFGAFDPSLTPELREIAERALTRIKSDDHSDV